MEKRNGLTVEDVEVGAEDWEKLKVELSKETFGAYKDKATQQFKKVLLDKISWISEKCWPEVLELRLKEMNRVIEAGKKMGVTAASIFTEAEIKELAEQFAPFRVLEMNEEIRSLLFRVLNAKGVNFLAVRM